MLHDDAEGYEQTGLLIMQIRQRRASGALIHQAAVKQHPLGRWWVFNETETKLNVRLTEAAEAPFNSVTAIVEFENWKHELMSLQPSPTQLCVLCIYKNTEHAERVEVGLKKLLLTGVNNSRARRSQQIMPQLQTSALFWPVGEAAQLRMITLK